MATLPHNPAFLAIALSVCALGTSALQEAPPSKPTQPAPSPIDVPITHAEPKFRLIGRLGKPIGETVTLQGLVVEGPTKGYEGGPNIIVQRLNGVPTQHYLRMPIAPYLSQWGTESESSKGKGGVPKLVMGATFELQGYETGGFVGIPGDAYRRAGVLVQTGSHHFSSVVRVFAGNKIEPIQYAPADFIDHQALLEGTARNRGTVPAIEGTGWEIVLDGPPWPPAAVAKLVHAFGTVRKNADGSFRLEWGADVRRGLVKLEDQLDQEVTLRGTGWSMNAERTFHYRGETLSIEAEKDPTGEVWPHGDAVSVTGLLQRLPQPQKENHGGVITYTLKRATWRCAEELLVPEIDTTRLR